MCYVCVGASERQTSIAAGDDGNTDLLFAITAPTKDENGSCVCDSHAVSSVYPGRMDGRRDAVCVCASEETNQRRREEGVTRYHSRGRESHQRESQNHSSPLLLTALTLVCVFV